MSLGFHCGSKDKESACNAGHPGSIPGSDLLESKWVPSLAFLAEEFRGQRSWVTIQSGITESYRTERLRLPLWEVIISSPRIKKYISMKSTRTHTQEESSKLQWQSAKVIFPNWVFRSQVLIASMVKHHFDQDMVNKAKQVRKRKKNAYMNTY